MSEVIDGWPAAIHADFFGVGIKRNKLLDGVRKSVEKAETHFYRPEITGRAEKTKGKVSGIKVVSCFAKQRYRLEASCAARLYLLQCCIFFCLKRNSEGAEQISTAARIKASNTFFSGAKYFVRPLCGDRRET
jgi:hypothetical protein